MQHRSLDAEGTSDVPPCHVAWWAAELGANLVGCEAGAGEGLAALVHAGAHAARGGARSDSCGPARHCRGATQGGAHALCVGRPQGTRVVVRLRIDTCGTANDPPSELPGAHCG